MQKKYLKYLTIVSAASCCWLFADKSISSVNAGKNIEKSSIDSVKKTNPSVQLADKKADDSDKTVNGYPKVKYKYEVDDNGGITIYPFLQYSHVNEDGGISWSEPVKDINSVKEYFNEEMIDIMSDGGKHNVDISMLEE
ncbi:MAG: hypothetical protein HFH68_12560 [Lachnospiraceae bacterium]|nr:hypothetical protein [Lachnospiraceae bacterium]